MSCIHFKFKSSREYDTLTFDGLSISLGDLRKAIIQHKRLGTITDFELQITNAQTGEGKYCERKIGHDGLIINFNCS